MGNHNKERRKTVTIDEEFQKLIPPLTDDEYRQLEENCIKEGIREAILVWDRGDDLVIVDGHNRYKIAREHNLKWSHKVMSFKNRETVKAWIRCNQLGRRNLDKWQKYDVVKELEEAKAKEAKERQSEAGGDRKSENKKIGSANIGTSDFGKTREKMAALVGVSHGTYDKMKKIDEQATPKVKEAVRKGELSINQAYNSTFPKVLDPVREAKERHEAFQEKAKEDVVDFKDAMLDKYDQEILYHSFVQDIYKMTGAVSKFGLLYQTKDIEAFAEKIPQELKEKIILNIGISINTLDSLKKILERRKQ